ncbi:hypothetical protein [Pseudomonas sp. GD03944]|uniref:hypothetical protein n=1 Tax=Pseudomonas sp. GD03944 TaxID=2975409 RepID=UPI00244BFD59|nr:hypothetical protein [Pseudomonas sp. GD03944]MDH1261979.1 hypothetical protein [Pseudomonas sp. GD03944]
MNMTRGSQTIAVFRKYEKLLDAALDDCKASLESEGLVVKSLCCREYLKEVGHQPIALEWGLLVEKIWYESEQVFFINTHVSVQEPWSLGDPIFLRGQSRIGKDVENESIVLEQRRYGGSADVLLEVGLAKYVKDRLDEIRSSIR